MLKFADAVLSVLIFVLSVLIFVVLFLIGAVALLVFTGCGIAICGRIIHESISLTCDFLNYLTS